VQLFVSPPSLARLDSSTKNRPDPSPTDANAIPHGAPCYQGDLKVRQTS
jgi:hypothetical protein